MRSRTALLVCPILIAAGFMWGCSSHAQFRTGGPATPASSLELVSPNGQNKIVLSAMDRGCGIWAGPADMQTGPMVAIYTQLDDPNTGVIGVWGPGRVKDAIDIAIVGDGSGGHVQVVNRQDGDKPVHFFQSKLPAGK